MPVRPAVALPFLALVALLAGLLGAGLSDRALAAGTTNAGQELHVIDGDTLQSGAEIVQLYGIDAPELGQFCRREGKPWACGVDAAFALQKLLTLSGSPVVCEAWSQGAPTAGPNGELIRVCRLGSDQDLALAMLRNGYGVAPPGTFPYYVQIERQARATGLGIWASEFLLPSDWRNGERLEADPGQALEDCTVKTRLGGAGERLYVVPTDADYQDPAAGGKERFCSDEAARAAGWRRAGQTDDTAAR